MTEGPKTPVGPVRLSRGIPAPPPGGLRGPRLRLGRRRDPAPPARRCVSICSLAFSMDGMFLSASSNTETVHIFKLETVKEK